ncbi:MAG TPA: hypothetical protein VKA48_05320 [Gammaproteobacteria bacterium]|nr:hypothetical protein [Gammaproteobacteria bacterium]
MLRILTAAILLALSALSPAVAGGNPKAPWGHASLKKVHYSGEKVVFDVRTGNLKRMRSVLDRASYLSQLNGANPLDTSIILVLHGHSIHFFAIEHYPEYKKLMTRAQSLTVGGIIQFRMCKLAAASQGYDPEDIHGFVTMVPMAEAEIIRLEQKGYAYMR